MIFDHVVLGLLFLIAMFCVVLVTVMTRKLTRNDSFIV
jgi:TRAP-type C4-dicarboxylate transport system permease small subunit